MSEQLEPFPRIDPTLNQIIAIFGRKRSGKSVFAREMFRGWTGVDKLVIDPSGDADPGADLGTITLRSLPLQLPRPARRGEHTVTRWIPDPASSSYAEDLDRAVGLALHPKDVPTLMWVDEVGRVFPTGSKGQTGPNGRTFLEQSRHYYTSALLCGPRPVGVDPLVISQADRVVMYDLPHPKDRTRLAENIGRPAAELVRELDELKRLPEHSFLMYDARTNALYQCPPLPISPGYKHAQQ